MFRLLCRVQKTRWWRWCLMEHIRGFIWGDGEQKVVRGSVYCHEGLWLCTNTFHLTAWSRAADDTPHMQPRATPHCLLHTLAHRRAHGPFFWMLRAHTETSGWCHIHPVCGWLLDAAPQPMNFACHPPATVLLSIFPGCEAVVSGGTGASPLTDR